MKINPSNYSKIAQSIKGLIKINGQKMDLEKLQKELIVLRHEKRINDAQNRLFETFINMVKSSNEEHILNVTMQSVLDIAAQFAGAEKGSLFLLDKNGVVTDSVLTQNQITGEQRSSLIGKVVDNGLAGWVKKNLCVGLITDTETDDRWLTLPDQSYIVRSALVVPILRHDKLFGIITLMHSLPAHFDKAAVRIVRQAANQMALTIENVKLYRKLEKANHAIEKYSKALNDELEQGKKIQKDFLPKFLPKIHNCDIAYCFHAALRLSGDFYDLFKLPDNHIGFVIGDVSGKGVGAALFMALTRSLMRIFSGSFNTGDDISDFLNIKTNFLPEDALKAVFLTNEYLSSKQCKETMFVTIFFGVINPETGKVFYVNGGHEPVVIIGENKIKHSLKATGPAVGVIPGVSYEVKNIQLASNDIMLGFTDGVTEARSKTRDFYTRTRFEKIIKNGFKGSSNALLEAIKTDLFTFTGDASQSDDITMLALKWHS